MDIEHDSSEEKKWKADIEAIRNRYFPEKPIVPATGEDTALPVNHVTRILNFYRKRIGGKKD
jgi:hypothetical protein